MNKLFLFITACIIAVFSCNHAVKTYQNNLGISPAELAQMDFVNYSQIEWGDTVFNIGKIRKGDSAIIKFRFRNTGEKALFIINVRPSCGCTVADYPKNSIMPGMGGEVKVKFDSRSQYGFIQKTIAVISNTSNAQIHTLKFWGEVTDSTYGLDVR